MTKRNLKSHSGPAGELKALIIQIKARLKKVDDYRVSAAILIHEARELVQEGAAGEGVKWSEWAPKQFRIGYREIKRLALIGGAPSPEAAMEDYRAAEATRMKELRAKRKEAEKYRRELVALEPEKVTAIVDTERHHHELAMAKGEVEPPEFNEEDFVVEAGDVRTPPTAPPVEDDEDVDGIEPITERMDEATAERLRIWNTTIRNFVSLTHERRRQFVQWAVGMCVEPGSDEDLLDIPAFLRRK